MIDMRQKRWSLNNRILWFGDASSSTGTTKEICSASGGLPPMHKRKQYYESLSKWPKGYEKRCKVILTIPFHSVYGFFFHNKKVLP